jgi:hypothetical protein
MGPDRAYPNRRIYTLTRTERLYLYILLTYIYLYIYTYSNRAPPRPIDLGGTAVSSTTTACGGQSGRRRWRSALSKCNGGTAAWQPPGRQGGRARETVMVTAHTAHRDHGPLDRVEPPGRPMCNIVYTHHPTCMMRYIHTPGRIYTCQAVPAPAQRRSGCPAGRAGGPARLAARIEPSGLYRGQIDGHIYIYIYKYI